MIQRHFIISIHPFIFHLIDQSTEIFHFGMNDYFPVAQNQKRHNPLWFNWCKTTKPTKYTVLKMD